MENHNFNQNEYNNSQEFYKAPPPKRSNGMASASLILGIISLITCCCFYLSIPLGVMSIIFAVLSKGDSHELASQGKTGMILSISSICISLILVISIFWTVFRSNSGRDEFRDSFKGYMEYYGGDTYSPDELDDMLDYFFRGPEKENRKYDTPPSAPSKKISENPI